MNFFYRSLRSWMERLSEDFVDGDGRQRRAELIVVVVSALSLCGRTGRSWACCSTSCGSDWWQFVFWDCDGARPREQYMDLVELLTFAEWHCASV